MLRGFKEFIMRGNLVELAVAFVVAAAFGVVVTKTVDVILSLVGKLGGQPDFNAWRPAGIPLGALITAIVSFLILAAVVYFLIVVPYNKLKERQARGEEPAPPADDIRLLQEIRDLLAARDQPGGGGGHPGESGSAGGVGGARGVGGAGGARGVGGVGGGASGVGGAGGPRTGV
jgi:large conductance mechanosensitive channel